MIEVKTIQMQTGKEDRHAHLCGPLSAKQIFWEATSSEKSNTPVWKEKHFASLLRHATSGIIWINILMLMKIQTTTTATFVRLIAIGHACTIIKSINGKLSIKWLYHGMRHTCRRYFRRSNANSTLQSFWQTRSASPKSIYISMLMHHTTAQLLLETGEYLSFSCLMWTWTYEPFLIFQWRPIFFISCSQ